MPTYKYKAMNLNGVIETGELEAHNETDLKLLLKKEGLLLLNNRIKETKKPSLFFELKSTPSKNDVVLFIRQLSIMVSAGIQVEDAIKTINEQSASKPLKRILIQIEESLYEGALFSQSLDKFPRVFPAYFRNIIYIGELSGQLPSVLLKAADYYEKDGKMKRKAKAAMVYPTFLLTAIIGVFIFLVMFIVPRFQNTLTELNAEVPEITRIIINISDYISKNITYLLMYIFLGLISIWLFFKTKKGRLIKDYLKLKFPILGTVTYYLITTRFSKGLSVLVSSGMSVMESIEIIGKLMDNVVFEGKFQYVIDEIKSGKKIHQSIEYINFFPKMLVEMVNVGESTGRLDDVLDITSDYYDEQLEQSIQKATSMLEPIIILIAGVLVGVVVLSVMLPMLKIVGSVDV